MNWTNYYKSVVSLPITGYFDVETIFVDKNNVKWFGLRYNDYILKYNDSEWIVYDTLNKNPYQRTIEAFAEDSSGNLWIAWQFPVKFDGSNWKIYNDFPLGSVASIAVDSGNIVWLSGSNIYKQKPGGLVRYRYGVWTIYDSTNSPLPYNPSKIKIDKHGNKWMIINGKGMVIIYREGGVIGITDVEDDRKVEENKILCYPNPSSGRVRIRYRIDASCPYSLYITNALGQRQLLIDDECKYPGDYVEDIDLSFLPQGYYFCVLQAGKEVCTVKIMINR